MPKPVFIESRNLTANFPDDATQEEINAAIVELFPRNGQDVAYDLSKFKEAGGKDSEFIANISDEDYIRLNNYRADKKLSTGEFFGIAGEALGTIVGDAFGGLKAAVTEAGEGVLESAARGVGAGTVDLVNLGQKLITPNQRIPAKDEFLQQPRTVYGYAYGPGGPSISQVPATERDYQTLIDQERAMELQSLELAEVAQDLIEGAPVPEVAKGASYIDALTLAGLAKSVAKAGVKSVFKKTAQAPITTTARPIPGVAATIETGESVIPEAVRQNAEAFATKVGEGARKAGFTGVQLGAGAVKKTADLGTAVIDAANKIGLGDSAVRGAVGAAIGYQQGGQEGALQGALAGAIIPKVARGGLRAVSGTADFIGAAAKVGKSGPSRTGIFERMAQAADISPQARNFAEKVLFTQPLVQATGEGLRQAATRSLIGAPVGAALGYAADGPEGAAAGLGAGVGISVLGGALDAGIDSIKTLAGKSTARSQRNAIGDIRSFVNAIPDDISRTGYAELMDKAIKIAGPERAADMLDSLRIAEGMGATVEIVPPSQRSKAFNAFDYSGGGGGKITINPDRMNAGSVAHETFHQFFNVGLKTELQQALRDLYLGRKDADGNVIQQGLWDDTEFSKRAAQLAERYKDNPEGYAYALKQADILNNPAGFSPEAIDQARMFIIDEMTAEYSEAFMGRSRPGTFNPDRLPLWHRQMLQRMDDIILNRISDKVYGDRNIKDPTAPFTDDNGKPIRVPQLDSVLKRAWSNKMSRERGQTAGKIGKPKEVVIPTKPRDLVVFAQATFGATRDVLGSDEQGNPRILTDAERKQQAKADFEEAKAKYQTLSDDDKAKVSVTDRTGQPVDINSPNAQIRITSQTPESVFEQFLQVAKDRGMGNQQISNMRQLFAAMAANEGPTFNTVNNPVYKFNKRTGQMRAETRPPTRQEIYPLLIHVNSVGGFNVQYVDMSRVKANAQKILDNPQYKGIWNGMDDFMNDFKRSLQNLSADNAIPSAELLGNGNAKIGAVKRDLIAESMNVTLPKRLEYANQPVIDPLTLLTSAGKERRVGGSAIRDFRIERLTEVIPTNERMKVVQENAYERLVRRYQPSAFTKETLPNGEAMTNPDGYRILKQTGGKLFRVYDDKGELIGTTSTETAAMKKAQSDAAKKVTKEEPTSTKRFQPDAAYRTAIQSGDSGTDNLGALIKAAPAADRASVIKQWTQRNPQSAAAVQKMVDEAAKAAGYDSVRAFHGTASNFTQFMREKLGQMTGAESAKRAFFFTDSEPTAATYARKAATFAEDIQIDKLLKDAAFAERRGNWDEYERLILEAENLEFGEKATERRKTLESESARVLKVYLRGNYMELDAAGNNYVNIDNAPDFDQFGGSLTSALEFARENNFDGVQINNFDDAIAASFTPATHWAVFDPNQIKSADPITFDDAGNIIPLSQRFNVESPDIRFQPDAASPSILNGSNGTRIIKSPSGKFRVYSVTGTLLGIRDTEQAAKKLATK